MASENASSGGRWRWLLVGLLLVGYAALSHYSNTVPGAKGLAAALSLGPLLIVGLVILWRSLSPLAALAITAASAPLVYFGWPSFERHYEWSDLIQQVLIYGLIAASFGLSLRAGRVPVCAQIAERVHGETLDARERAYLRRATAAWALFYAVLTAAVLLLFIATPLRVWSLFVNFIVFALIALMCIGEHAVRRHVLPRRAPGGLVTALRQALIG